VDEEFGTDEDEDEEEVEGRLEESIGVMVFPAVCF
jgi:uncharacterized protein YgfB (UPF0149 family)